MTAAAAMASWRDMELAAPEIARLGMAQLTSARVALLGTLRRDGSPRVSPIEPYLVGGQLLIGAMAWTAKAADLRRDPRYVLHSAVTGPDTGEGELKLYGQRQKLTQTFVSCFAPTMHRATLGTRTLPSFSNTLIFAITRVLQVEVTSPIRQPLLGVVVLIYGDAPDIGFHTVLEAGGREDGHMAVRFPNLAANFICTSDGEHIVAGGEHGGTRRRSAQRTRRQRAAPARRRCAERTRRRPAEGAKRRRAEPAR